jgi:hypothetical protein
MGFRIYKKTICLIRKSHFRNPKSEIASTRLRLAANGAKYVIDTSENVDI